MRHILFFLPVAMLLAACTQDEQTGEALPEPIPLQLTAAMGEAVATPAKAATRATTVDGQWPESGTVYVQISETEDGFDDDKVLNYSVDASGNLKPQESKDIYYWTKNNQTIYVRAWYPGGKTDWNGIPKEEDGMKWTAGSDQSNEADLAKDDFLYAYKDLTFGSQPYTLEFRHLMSKITINLVNSPYLKQYDPAKVSVSLTATNTMPQAWLVDGAFEDSGSELKLSEASPGSSETTITPFSKSVADEDYYASYEAIVIPQGVTNTNKGIQVKVGNATYQWEMELAANQMYSGNEYTFNITVDAKGLTVSAGSSISWNNNGTTGEGTVTIGETNG